jgi:hypothetical protein
LVGQNWLGSGKFYAQLSKVKAKKVFDASRYLTLSCDEMTKIDHQF